jgi:hypothetical protein
MKKTQTFSVLIWANKAKETKDGLPLFARVTVDGKRIEISLKKKVPSDLWDGKAGVVTGSGESVKFLNNYIAQVKAKLFKIFKKMEILEEHITAEAIKLKFTGEKEEIKTLLQFDGRSILLREIILYPLNNRIIADNHRAIPEPPRKNNLDNFIPALVFIKNTFVLFFVLGNRRIK